MPNHEGHEVSTSIGLVPRVGVPFKDFMFFMVKSRCMLAGFSNSGMLLTLQVSLPPVNRTVKLDGLDEGGWQMEPVKEISATNVRFSRALQFQDL